MVKNRLHFYVYKKLTKHTKKTDKVNKNSDLVDWLKIIPFEKRRQPITILKPLGYNFNFDHLTKGDKLPMCGYIYKNAIIIPLFL